MIVRWIKWSVAAIELISLTFKSSRRPPSGEPNYEKMSYFYYLKIMINKS